MTRMIDGIEYEIVWNGGEGLSGVEATKRADVWIPPPRLYNKTGKYRKPKQLLLPLDNKIEVSEDVIQALNGDGDE